MMLPNHRRRLSAGTTTPSPVATVAAVLVMLHLWTTTVAAPPPMGLPGCPTSCGDVTVPYPFGISANCSFPGFNLTCDRSQDPPRLLLGDGASSFRVTDIFLHNASMRILSGAAVNHTSKWVSEAIGTWAFLDRNGSSWPYALSYHNNKLFAVGCDIQATLLQRNDYTRVVTGCASFCAVDGLSNKAIWGPATDGSDGCHPCTGNGCCKASIPLYYPSYDVHLKKLDPLGHNPVGLWLPNMAFIGEQSRINQVWCQIFRWMYARIRPGAPSPLQHLVPVMLEWAMASAPPAQPGEVADNTSRCLTVGASSACKSRYSYCHNMNTPFRSGYSCQCSEGFDGNPYLSDGCQDINECADPHNHNCYGECINKPGTYECRCPRGFRGNSSMINGCVKTSEGLSIALGVGSGAIVLFIVVSTAFIISKVKERRKKRLRQRFFKQNRGQLLQQLVCQNADIAERMIITLEELEKATNNFDKSRELGGGGHGTIYKGILSSQHVVAIKKSKIVIQREIDEFINEVAILSQVNHRNIVKLHGCCLETEVPLLVYEFISNGTLYNHLHVEGPLSISWKDRMRIAVETTRALTYLHSLVSKPIIHRDVKSPNILLDDNLIVKLSDFGASRYIPIDQDEVQTSVRGTLGYLDPMYSSTGLLTEKSDVYSFGVLLIELLTRKKPDSYRTSQGFGLANHFVSLLSEDNLVQILDPQVYKEGDGEIIDISLLAAICVKFRSDDRPTMRQVEMTLESIQASKEFSSEATEDDDDDDISCDELD
ncbi:unnamed protein product [Urochloa decumbens]|uniref:Protein kinase domain-containing protein n=1 Tax=Urochloa decumbens TaxID=240449 RepID=A0ABC9AUG8_9POAL